MSQPEAWAQAQPQGSLLDRAANVEMGRIGNEDIQGSSSRGECKRVLLRCFQDARGRGEGASAGIE